MWRKSIDPENQKFNYIEHFLWSRKTYFIFIPFFYYFFLQDKRFFHNILTLKLRSCEILRGIEWIFVCTDCGNLGCYYRFLQIVMVYTETYPLLLRGRTRLKWWGCWYGIRRHVVCEPLRRLLMYTFHGLYKTTHFRNLFTVSEPGAHPFSLISANTLRICGN